MNGQKTLEELVAEARKQPGGEEILRKWAEETMAHHENPLYKRAAEWTNQTRAAAINKGAGKYPKPLAADTYTFHELFEHAMAENVDQQHYLTALLEKFETMQVKLERAEYVLKDIAAGKFIADACIDAANWYFKPVTLMGVAPLVVTSTTLVNNLNADRILEENARVVKAGIAAANAQHAARMDAAND